MAAGAVNEPAGDAAAAEVAALRAERDELEQRALEAEQVAEQLAEQLADAQQRLAATAAATAAGSTGAGGEDDDRHLTLFDGAPPSTPRGRLAPDGSDPAVLPIALAATAVVAFLAAAMTVLLEGVTFLGFVVLLVAGGLAWAAYRTRVVPSSVDVVDGVVVVTHGDDTKRFDLRNDGVKVDVQGSPGDTSWRVRFYRRALDPVDVDASMVDPADFMSRLREARPGL